MTVLPSILCCHPEQAFFAQRKPGLSEAEGDLGEPRVAARLLRRNNRAFWLASSLFLTLA
jgi:hypothetical protein